MSKVALRTKLKQIRQQLSSKRRAEASHNLKSALLPVLDPHTSVLSFSSLSQEIDTSSLNRFLASSGKLLLPKMVEDTLVIFCVTNIDTQLVKGAFGLYEPNPNLCDEVAREEIEIVLVPALGFDKSNHRIGYGKGFYDRFLASIECPTIGVGYHEQLVDSILTEPTDIPLKTISLF